MNPDKKILLCDRDELRGRRSALTLTRISRDWMVQTVFEAKNWAQILREGHYDCILLQEKGFSGNEGLNLLRDIREKDNEVPVILLSEEPHLDSCLKAFHLGIFDYLREPCSEEEIVAVLRLALERHDLKNQKERLLQDLIDTNAKLAHGDGVRTRGDLSFKSFIKTNQILSKCLKLVMDFFDANKGVALLHDQKNHTLIVKESLGFNGHFSKGSSFEIHGNQDLEKIVFQGKTCFLTSVDGRLVSAPLGVPPDVFGILCMGRSGSFTEGELRVLSVFAPLIPYALEGNRLYSELETTRNGGVLSLLLLIEEKDPKLWQHANRVMEYSCALAKTIMGLPEETIQSIRLAALLHEVGRIAEPSPLRERIQRMTFRVIEPLRLPKETKEILHYQAERMDGKEEEIPIGARILAIADAYDEAMNQGKSREEVLNSLTSHAGSRFDPIMLEHFRLLFQAEENGSGTLQNGMTEPLHSQL